MATLTKEEKAEQAKIAAAENAAKAATDKAANQSPAGDNKIADQMAAMQKTIEDMQGLISAQANTIASIKGAKQETKEELPTIPKDSVKSGKKKYKVKDGSTGL